MGLQLLYPKSKVLICFQHFIIIKPDFWKRQQKLSPKLPILKKKECSHCFFSSRPFFLLALSFSRFLVWFSSLLSAKSLPFSSFSFSWLQVSLKVRFQKTARYISLHKKADFFNCMQCCFGSLSHSKFCIRKIHAKILAKT